MDLIYVGVSNWEKFNPRNDRPNNVWFRFQNKFFTDPRIFNLTAEQQRLLIFIYCLRSEKNSAEIEFSYPLVSAILKRKPADVLKDLNILEDSGLVTVRQPSANHLPTAGSPTDRQTDITDKHNKHGDFDFEGLYKKYPRKLGKKDGIARCERLITTPEDFAKLAKAIDLFIEYHKSKKTEEKFIPYFSTFMSDWESWLDPTTGTVTLPKSQSSIDEWFKKKTGEKNAVGGV